MAAAGRGFYRAIPGDVTALGYTLGGNMTFRSRQSATEPAIAVEPPPARVINMLAYLMKHDAHHRGQICILAGALGHEFSGDDTMRHWGWKAISPRPPQRELRRRAASQPRAHS